MASQPQPLPPALPCASPTAAGGAGLAASSPEKGTARPKPPVRPKPRVLPKPAVPAKPSLPQPPPGPRHPRPELPSAEKLNRLAGPQPYSAGGAGGPVRRPSFTIKSPETSNGKGLPSPSAAAAEDSGSIPGEEVPPALLTPPRKSPSPFKVTPVPVATKPERFPGTTVEEILAKMDSREGPGSPDRARLSPFCPDPSPRFGSKTFSAFRRRPSGAADGAPPAEPHQTPQPVAGELGKEHDGHRVAETSSSSPPAGPSCAGDPRGCRRPPSPADLSSLQPSALGAPGSPRHPTSPAPGAPFQPTQPPISTPGSPDAPAELPAPGSPTPAPSSPESPAQPPAEVPATPSQAPGAPCSTAEPRPGASRSPGSPHTPGEGSPDTGSPPTTPELPPRVTCPPGSPESAAERWGPPSPAREPPVKVSCPPGSPEGPDDSSASPQSPKGPDSSPPPPSRDSGLRRCSEGLLQPLPVGQGLGELGGSLSTLPHPGDPPPELSLGGWNLSQSFEWTFPGQGAQRLVSPPCSPIRETPDLGLSIECELDGGDPAPRPSCSRGNSGSEEPCPTMASSWAAEGAPCPGGPVAQREAEGSAEEEEGEAEQDATVPCCPLCVTEPGQDPAEPEPPAQPNCPIMAAPMDPAPTDPPPTAELAWAPVGDRPGSLQGPGGPGRAEGPSKGADPHADPGWLTELLASPRAHRTGLGSPNAEGLEDQLSWSPKGLCGDFGAGSPHHGTFSWSCEAVARERDWPGETERDRDPETKPDWGSAHSAGDGDRQDRPFGSTRRDWGSAYQGTELTGETSLGCSDWPESRGTGESCRQDQDFGAGKPQWGSGEESGSGRADWSSGCGLGHGLGHGQQRDREPGSRQHSWAGMYGSGHPERRDGDITSAWAGEYSAGNVEMKDRDLSLGWTREYSSRDPETKDEDLTLGWAGRSSTGDTGTPEKEFSPSRVAWDSEYSAQDMESQDREFSPSRPAWTGDTSTRDMESQDREFSPSRPAWTGDTSTRDMESQDQEFSPSRPAWTGDTSTRDMESQDREFSPSQPPWDDEYRTRDVEMQDEEFSSSRVAWASEGGSREVESRDSGCKPGRPTWDSGYSTGDVGSQDREFSPSQAARVSEHGSANTAKEGEFSHERLSWAGERSLGQTELVSAFGVGKDDASGCHGPEAPEPGWGSTGWQECDVTGSRDWAGELGGAERHNQFGVIGTERVPEPYSARAPSDGSVSWTGGLGEPLGAWHRALDFGSSGAGGAGAVGLGQPTWGTGLGSLAVPNTPTAPNTLPAPSALPTPGSAGLEEPGWSGGCDTEATRQEWASAFGARCAARSRDFSAAEQSLGGDASSTDGTLHLSAPSPPVGDTLAVPHIEECPRSEPPSPTEEEQDVPAPADPPHSPSLRAAGGSLPDSESEGSPAEHPDRGSPPSGQGEQPCPAGPLDCAGQDFSFLEDTAVLDSSVYRSKASLGRKRPHRAPALRPAAAAEGDSWIFRDSTEPRAARPDASSDEEAVEEPRSRRVRASPLGRGVKVPLFPSLSASALKAKLRGRNRSAEEGAVPGDGKATPPRDPHVQRSKSCKIPGLSGKPLALPPKPDKSSGSDASPPHWLQALKLKKKKP